MIKYKTYKWENLEVSDNDYNKWALEMLILIANNEGWEETQDKYFKLFFE